METIKKNWLGFSIALIILLWAFSCNNSLRNELSMQKRNVISLNKENVSYRTKNGDLVNSVNTLQYDKTQLNDLILSNDKKLQEISDRFSKIQHLTKYITNTKFDTIKITYKDSIPFVFKKKDSIKEKWYSFKYMSDQKGLSIKDLIIPDSISIVSGIKRNWFLGKETQTIDISHSNPNIQSLNIQHIQVPKNKSFVEKYFVKELLSFALGVYIAK